MNIYEYIGQEPLAKSVIHNRICKIQIKAVAEGISIHACPSTCEDDVTHVIDMGFCLVCISHMYVYVSMYICI